jgi:anaphase-promoting complex subunit 6
MLLKGYEFKEALKVTTNILDHDPYNRACLPTHIACLYELKDQNQLYLIAHKLVEALPSDAISWFAVGSFYLLKGKNHEARRYFSKSSDMDPLLGCSWIGFGHTFAFESEHDPAISAYTSASRLLKGYSSRS